MKLTNTAFWIVALMIVTYSRSQAAVVVTAIETGGDVVFSGSGTLNLADLTFNSDTAVIGSIGPASGHLTLGATPATSVAVDWYGIGQLTTPGPFGTNFTEVTGDSGSGDRFGIFNPTSPGPLVAVPDGYVSGDPLAAVLTFTGTDFATLGVSKGTYVWSWGSGGDADSLTLNIIPEPSALVLMALGGFWSIARRHRCDSLTPES